MSDPGPSGANGAPPSQPQPRPSSGAQPLPGEDYEWTDIALDPPRTGTGAHVVLPPEPAVHDVRVQLNSREGLPVAPGMRADAAAFDPAVAQENQPVRFMDPEAAGPRRDAPPTVNTEEMALIAAEVEREAEEAADQERRDRLEREEGAVAYPPEPPPAAPDQHPLDADLSRALEADLRITKPAGARTVFGVRLPAWFRRDVLRQKLVTTEAVFLYIVGAVLLDVVAAMQIARGDGWVVTVGIVMHVLAAGAVALLTTRLYTGGMDWLVLLFVGLFALGIPVVGPLGASAAALSSRYFGGNKHLLTDFTEYIKYDEIAERKFEPIRDLRELLSNESEIQPIADILSGTDVDLKRGAIARLAKVADRPSVAMLQKALSDASPEIQFYAQSALSQIEEARHEAIKTANERVEGSPMSAAAHRSLGDNYFDFVFLELLDAVTAEHYCRMSIRAYEESLERDVAQPDVMLRIARAYLRLANPEAARRYLDAAIDRRPDDPRIRLWRCEAAYNLGDYPSVLADARIIVQQIGPTGPVGSAAAFWVQQAGDTVSQSASKINLPVIPEGGVTKRWLDDFRKAARPGGAP